MTELCNSITLSFYSLFLNCTDIAWKEGVSLLTNWNEVKWSYIKEREEKKKEMLMHFHL